MGEKEKWEEQCYIVLSQTREGRAQKRDPQASLRCIQRLLDAEGRVTGLRMKHSTDFAAILAEAMRMAGEEPSEGVESGGTGTGSGDGSGGDGGGFAEVEESFGRPKLDNIPGATAVEEWAGKGLRNNAGGPTGEGVPLSVAAWRGIRDTYDPAKEYLKRIYSPYYHFLHRYQEALRNGTAFSILGRYWDALIVEQRPASITRGIFEKWRGWWDGESESNV